MCFSFFVAHNIFQIDLNAIEKDFFIIPDKLQQGDRVKGLILRLLNAYCGTASTRTGRNT